MWLILLLSSCPSPPLPVNLNRTATMTRSSYISPAKKTRNMSRLVSYLKHKLNISARILLPTNLPICLQPSQSNSLASTRNTFSEPNLSSTKPLPQLSKTVALRTSFPEACPVCSKHQCEVDFKQKLVQSMDEAFEKTFKDLKENTDKQIAKYSTDLEQNLKLP